MKKLWKRPISFALALLLVTTMVPFQTTALALEDIDSSSVVVVDGNTVQGEGSQVEVTPAPEATSEPEATPTPEPTTEATPAPQQNLALGAVISEAEQPAVQTVTPGWQVIDGNTYYVLENGEKKTGWLELDGAKYYLDPAKGGARVMGLVDIEVSGEMFTWYFSVQSGKLLVNQWVSPDYNNWYHTDKQGRVEKSKWIVWDEKSGEKRYVDENGVMQQPPTIDSVTTSAGSGGKIKVTVKATFKDSPAASTAYSFDGGTTWEASNSKEFATGTVLASGKIRIRDQRGYIVVYDQAVNIGSGSSVGFGIDVSAHQGPIDWAAMARDGVQFAIIRAVSSSGSSVVEDPYFRTNVRQAKANGILVGAYIYSYAFNNAEMKVEIDKFHTAMQALKAEGYILDMPVFIDYEDSRLYNAAGCPANNTERTNVVRYGMQLLESYGYYPGFYTYYNFAKNYLNYQQLMNEGYDFWLAHYGISQPSIAGVEMWQYSSSLTVGGRHPIDGNYCYKDYTDLIHGTGGGSHVEVQETLTVYDLNTNKVVTDTVTNILAQIVANEIGNTMLGGGKGVAATGADAQRAYEVQAVAAHSWITYQYANNYASLANPPKVGLKSLSAITNQTYRNLIVAAAEKVKDDYITYDGEVALTPYYACSGGKTNSSSDYWGRTLPYLVSVDLGSYEKDLVNRTGLKDYQPVTMTRTRAQLQADILKVQPKADLSGPLSGWIVMGGKNSAGYYTTVKLGGVETNIDAFYEGVTGPYSLNFEMKVNGEDSITFTSYGYGHCVGMSQYAMIQMAALGTMTTAQIATYFFPGTKYETIR